MNPKLLLRIASGLLVFHLLGHINGHMNWKALADPAKGDVVSKMTNQKFLFMGSERSMGDYFEGYGWVVSIALVFMAMILWFFSGSLMQNKKLSLKVLTTLCIALFVWCADEFIYFFPFAAGITLLAAICTLMATIQVKNQKV